MSASSQKSQQPTFLVIDDCNDQNILKNKEQNTLQYYVLNGRHHHLTIINPLEQHFPQFHTSHLNHHNGQKRQQEK